MTICFLATEYYKSAVICFSAKQRIFEFLNIWNIITELNLKYILKYVLNNNTMRQLFFFSLRQTRMLRKYFTNTHIFPNKTNRAVRQLLFTQSYIFTLITSISHIANIVTCLKKTNICVETSVIVNSQSRICCMWKCSVTKDKFSGTTLVLHYLHIWKKR